MPYTVADVLTRAAKRLRIVPAGDTLQDEDQVDILAAYNSMMFGFEAAGLSLLESDGITAYTHAAQAGTDDFPLADKYFDAVWAVLMEKLIGQFPVDASVGAGAAMEIRTGWDRLYGAFLTVTESDVGGMGTLASQTDRFWG
jgi:hypothetical protein